MSTAHNERYKILIVDDEKQIREMLSRHFRFLGYNVVTSGDGKEALSCMVNEKFDVVISDIKMPVMDGIELLRQIKLEYPMVHCIMITGYVTMENILACMRYGADTCVFKPFEKLDELTEAVKRVINQIVGWEAMLLKLLSMKPSAENGDGRK